MNEIMKVLLSLSLSGTLMLLFILGFKPMYKNKLSRRWQYYILVIAAIRFLFPFSFGTTIIGSMFERFGKAKISAEINVSQIEPVFAVDGNEAEQTDPEIDRSKAEKTKTAMNGIKAGQAKSETDRSETGKIKTAMSVNEEGQTGSKTDENDTGQTEEDMNQEPERAQLPSLTGRGILYLFSAWLLSVLLLFYRKITIYQGFIRYIRAGNTEVSDIKTLNLLSGCMEKLNIRTKIELYRNPMIVSPMMVGFFRPYIILPEDEIKDRELYYIFMHELVHCRQKDMFYKWMVQIVVCIHWLNPFVYLLEKEVNRACELSCDEKIISALDGKARREYGDTLISFMKSDNPYKNSLASVTMSEGAEQIKERLGAIMQFKKKSKTVIAATALLSVLFILCFFKAGAYAANNMQELNHGRLTDEIKESAVETAGVIYKNVKTPDKETSSFAGSESKPEKRENQHSEYAAEKIIYTNRVYRGNKAKEGKNYIVRGEEGTLSLFDDYDTVISLCSDACGEYIQSVLNKSGMNFTPYISNPMLIKYMQYRVNNHIYSYKVGSKYKFLVSEVDFRDGFALVKGRLATYSELDSTESSVCMEGLMYFVVKASDGKCVISDWYWGGLMDSPDDRYRGEFSISDDLDFWDNPSKYSGLLSELNIE